MADEAFAAEPSMMEKFSENLHNHGSSSSSDSDDDKHSAVNTMKSKVYRLFGREKPVHKILGGGKPADIFLWRNKKNSATVLGAATAIWMLFELLQYHLITLLCHVAILVLAVLFVWSNASTFIHKSPPHIPDVAMPEKCVLEVVSVLRHEINRGLALLREVASGRDAKKFLSVVMCLWIISVVGSWFNFITLFYLVFVLLHTVPMLYEKYEDQVDALGKKAMIEIKKQYAVLDEKFLSKIPLGPLQDKKKD
ncbi:hypothetical protein SAY86_018339 [Trapa natans]|uniref:Reticulon-like protein n=1 Tax=Trapa natans TaxID=22666 RepID=A0AAN7LD48_TRANT|nr:hypothetical protein SAY86_018339 [Trapa natans]